MFCLYFTGIGSFTIVDGKKVAPEDVGNKYVSCKIFDCLALLTLMLKLYIEVKLSLSKIIEVLINILW